MGGRAATPLCRAVARRGISIQTLLVFEAYYPADVACNVRQAIDLHGRAGSLNFARRLAQAESPGPPYHGRLVEMALGRWQDRSLVFSKEPEALRFVLDELIDGGKVRLRAASPGGHNAWAAG